MTSKTDYDTFVKQLTTKFNFLKSSNFEEKNRFLFEKQNDLFVLSQILYRLDSEITPLSVLEQELSQFVSRHAIFCYLGDEYLNQTLSRAIIESIYRIIISKYYPLRQERRIRSDNRSQMSRDINEKIAEDSCKEWLPILNNLYGKYSTGLHNAILTEKEIWQKLNSFGNLPKSIDNEIEDFKKIFMCLLKLYFSKEISGDRKLVDSSVLIYANNHLSLNAYNNFLEECS
ncbi:hypothetical protein [Weissella paramesenteroides]|uniref:hypothetical protein n=1 Tax=Weissella paramesenteroides TaxID=1249 RepID=UPI002E7BB110|nr:hypothetical protein [Weissella paramesenteroides]WPQ68417.1 hypothetical protein QRX23_02130 [Weissella paramesenteroides]